MTDEQLEHLAEQVHNAYLETCEKLGWEVKESNKVPYSGLSQDSKELDRASVRAVISHIKSSYVSKEKVREYIANYTVDLCENSEQFKKDILNLLT